MGEYFVILSFQYNIMFEEHFQKAIQDSTTFDKHEIGNKNSTRHLGFA